MAELSRRRFLLAGSALAASFGAVPRVFADEPEVRIVADTRVIEVAGRAARMFGLVDARTNAWSFRAGERFNIRLANALPEETLLHWHGLTPPAAQDNAQGPSSRPIAPGQSRDYDFILARPGTHWMQARHGLQLQRLLAAPLIVRDPAEAGLDEQDVTVLLQDFTFRDPREIQRELMLGSVAGQGHADPELPPDIAGMTQMPAGGAAMDLVPVPVAPAAPGCCNVTAASGVRLNDVTFDAYLANNRTLADPEVVRVEPGARVRLRLINAAAATNFVIDLGAIEARVIAVDGQPVVPIPGRQFPLAIGQRFDLRLALPAGAGVYPLFARREGDKARTGIILATRGTELRRIAERAEADAPALNLALEQRLVPTSSLATRPATRTHVIRLTGEHSFYRWRLDLPSGDAKGRLPVRSGERVELTFSNATNMAHPMHLHGHVFQIVAVDGRRIGGALRDTVLIPPATSVTIAFDADNPGDWPLACQNLYHQAVGMATTLTYTG
ncbi:MAG: multicopper oxidase family protein [Alphaproteobacteria bacterium]|nr:multicopper oxidase family protein [Alphaproteobacteria bacterium]